ncbi:S1C family serine protease [Psychrobacter sp. I-STPA10]|uniref:S1C family serine protease n=1 Tax=Psychrobacter sp. I-STPA10 TaxID=2585769 RepID=UPI001E4A78B6|nr:trypsin-like peptidase domain-containing protein [Psychrobacter sp. I-STPA10]
MSSSPNNGSSKLSFIWKLLPWLLLFIVIAVFGWFYMQQKSQQQDTWQPPRSEQNMPTLPLGEAKDKPVPITSYHDAVARASHSVVNIYTTQKVAQNPYLDDPILRRFYEFHGGLPQQDRGATNLGSGVVVSEDGYIVTNAHVISKADEIVVAFNDGRKSKATVVGVDPDSDLAVIKVDMTGLTPLAFREQPIEVGDVALAIGNPFGVGQTVTQGIISATDRTGLGINTFEDFIQTDAAINPGNSGGALVDAYGELVGINTAIFSRSGGSMGIGFAIPTAVVEQVMNAIIKEGRVSRGWLGIEVQSQIKDPTRIESSTGVEVLHIVPNSPAAISGLSVGDIILSIDGVEMTDANRLIQYVARKTPNTKLNLQVLRGQQNLDIEIVLAERPGQNELVMNPSSIPPQGVPPQELPPQVPMSPDVERYLQERPESQGLSEEDQARLREEILNMFQ